jgi:hypothetical protein
MKFWVRFSRTLFKLAALPLLNKIRSKSIESVLKNSINLLNEDMVEEIRSFIRKKQTPQGGFSDRAGKCDLYYSLFGYFIAEALSISEVHSPLKNWVKNEVSDKLTGVNLYCGAILYSKLHGIDDLSIKLGKQIAVDLKKSKQVEYSNFMGFLALYYLEDYLSIKRLINQANFSAPQKELPCPVIAATTILNELSGRNHLSEVDQLKSFYMKNGGFRAIKNAPYEDLLSTGVALYALHFVNADLRLMTPECLSFVDGLYENGGFRSTQSDFETDVEYTFYGLLALGSLN